MVNSLFIFLVALFMVIQGATFATKYAVILAKNYRLSKYVVGFIVIAVISILPELFISINSAISGIPSFGLGMLFGSNIADLTLILALAIFLTGRSLKVESKILSSHAVYPFVLLLPVILGLNGHFSRTEGLALIVTGGVFYYLALRKGVDGSVQENIQTNRVKSVAMLLVSMAVLLIGAHFSVISAESLAQYFGISPILIGMFVVGLGTTMPEFFFALKAIKKRDDSLAIGDILGTVLADATIVVGILALVDPFVFPRKIIYITGAFMVTASFMLFHFMRTGKTLTKREAWMLFMFWVFFILAELLVTGL